MDIEAPINQPQKPIEPDMQCPVVKVISFLEYESDLELSRLEVTDPHLINIRNHELFPFMKENTIV